MGRRKIIIIGLDGGSPELVEKWAVTEGRLPNLARLIEGGVFGRYRTSIPSISAAAWVSFMTGRNPGAHGVFDFRNYDPTRYNYKDIQIINSTHFSGTTFLDYMGQSGKKVGAMTIPVTYPAWEVNGFLVSGFPTPTSERTFSWPGDLGIEEVLTENNAIIKMSGEDAVQRELIRLVQARGRVTMKLMNQFDTDALVLVLGSPDRAQHNFWRHHDPSCPAHDEAEAERYGQYIFDVYRECDAVIGQFMKLMDSDTSLFVVSDHGSRGRPHMKFHTNAWLRCMGLLSQKSAGTGGSIFRRAFSALYKGLKKRFPWQEKVYKALPPLLKEKLVAVDASAMEAQWSIQWADTKAYRFPMYAPYDGVVINMTGRQEQGAVSSDDYEKVRDSIIAALRENTPMHNGRPVVRDILRREDIYKGEFLERSPDLILVLDDEFEGGSGFGNAIGPVDTEELRRLSGLHSEYGLLIGGGGPLAKGIALGEVPGIVDLAPTFCHAMGLAVPSCMEGRPVLGMFDPAYVSGNDVKWSDWGAGRTGGDFEITGGDSDDIKDQLKNLGYM